MEVVNQNCQMSLLAVQKELLETKKYHITKEILLQNTIWFSISSDLAYSPAIQIVTPIQSLDSALVYNITDFFTLDLTKSEKEQLEYRVSRLNALYYHLINCNPDLDERRIGNLLFANIEQNYNEHAR